MSTPGPMGLAIIEQTLSRKRSFGSKPPRLLHYHSRSDHHSVVSCWAMILDLMLRCDEIRRDIANGTLAFGINETLVDHSSGRKKNLDLVLGKPAQSGKARGKAKTFLEIVGNAGIVINDEQANEINKLPTLPVAPIGQVRLATEGKACMTEHVKSAPRLYDELTSSHATVHGNDPDSLALGLVMINVSDQFLSPTRDENKNLDPTSTPVMNVHTQPQAAKRVLEKVDELPIKGGTGSVGFDGLAVVMVDTDNDVRGFKLSPTIIDKKIQARFEYSSVIDRVAGMYTHRFR